MSLPKAHIVYWVALPMVAAFVFLMQLMVGSFPISFSDILHILDSSSYSGPARDIFLQSRLPAAIAATVGGAALSLGGLQMQTYFKNPVAGPFVLGISSGSSLGVAVFIMLSGLLGFGEANEWGLILASSLGALLIFLLVMFKH